MKKRKTDCRGTTLVELLVVMGIIGILAGVATVGISLAYSRDAEQCAEYIEMQMDKAQLLSASKPGHFVFRVASDTTGNYTEIVRDGAVLETKKLPSGVNISYEKEETPYAGATQAEIVFDKVNGIVETVTVTDGGGSKQQKMAVFRICCFGEKSGKKTAVELVTATGKHKLVYETGA